MSRWTLQQRLSFSDNSADKSEENPQAKPKNRRQERTAKKVEDRLNENVKGKEWRPVPDYEQFYVATDHGEIISLKSGRILSTKRTTKVGYFEVSLHRPNGHQRTFLVHRLVCPAFHGSNEGKREVNHKNFIKTDNRPENLEWCSRIENLHHAFHAGRKGGHSKLTRDQVDEIRQIGRSIPSVEIAKKFNVSKAAIYMILSGKRWPVGGNKWPDKIQINYDTAFTNTQRTPESPISA